MAVRKIFVRSGDLLNIHVVEDGEDLNNRGWESGSIRPTNFLLTATAYRITFHDPGINVGLEKNKDTWIPWFSKDHRMRFGEEVLASERKRYKELKEVALAMRDWIDAVPQETELPTMPGFDRDWADEVLEK